MNKLYSLALILILFSCQKEKEDSRVASIDSFLSGQAQYFKFNGNVLVAEHGKVIYKKSFGFSNFDTQETLNDSSMFELASISKQFTATAILLLKSAVNFYLLTRSVSSFLNSRIITSQSINYSRILQGCLTMSRTWERNGTTRKSLSIKT